MNDIPIKNSYAVGLPKHMGRIQQELEKVWNWRKEIGESITQLEAARILGLESQGYVSKLLNGEVSMSESQILILCEVLNVGLAINGTEIVSRKEPFSGSAVEIILQTVGSHVITCSGCLPS